MRVLYVDDEPDIREIARIALDLDGDMQVDVAASGEEAIEKAASWRPDVILLDVMMPEMDGPSTLTELRARDGTRHIAIIFITARTQAHEVERFKALGACAVIPKPFDPMSLASEVRAACRK